MTTPVCTIDATGIHAPQFDEILAYLKDAYRGIYGQDVYLENDSQDGQFLALLATAINDTNAMAVAVYNAFSPSTAQGTGLSSVVKINGIARAVATYSTVDLRVIGQAGTVIANGIAADRSGNRWALPELVTIPLEGEVTVTATCQTIGAVEAPVGAVTDILTVTRGWQEVTNPYPAVPGAPVEKDPALRRRQAISTALPSRTVLEGILGAVAQVPGVTRYRAYENDGDAADENGIPGHSIALVVEGGNGTEVAQVIQRKKTPGAGTYGDQVETVVDAYGIPHPVRYFRPTDVPIGVTIILQALRGFTKAIEDRIRQTVADYINAREIGEDLLLARLYVPANLSGTPDSATYDVMSIELSRDGDATAPANILLAFNEAATITPGDVYIQVIG